MSLLIAHDIVVTNPPFSLLNDYFNAVVKSGKKFLFIAPITLTSYCKVFPLLKEDVVRLGYTFYNSLQFYTDNDFTNEGRKAIANICWFTNLDVKDKKFLQLARHYSKECYKKYDKYDAIEVPALKDIPCDYFGKMGVPITFFSVYNKNQFMICGKHIINLQVDGKQKFARVIIKRKTKDTKRRSLVWQKIGQ